MTLQFDLNRNIDGAAREVQAAINASRVDLPATLRSNPTYRKANPADAPVHHPRADLEDDDAAADLRRGLQHRQQRLAQVDGVGDVEIGGGSLPAVRVELLPFALNSYGIAARTCAPRSRPRNANRPKGSVEGDGRRLQIYTQTPAPHAADYAPMVVAWRNGAAVRLSDVASVTDGVEDTRTLGLFNGEPAVIVLDHAPARRQRHRDGRRRARAAARAAGAAAGRHRAATSPPTAPTRSAPRCARSRSRCSISIALVVLVVSVFLRSLRATRGPGGRDDRLAARHLRRDVPARLQRSTT